MCSTSSGEQVLTLNKIIKKQKQGKVVKIIRQIDELKKNGSKWISIQKTNLDFFINNTNYINIKQTRENNL